MYPLRTKARLHSIAFRVAALSGLLQLAGCWGQPSRVAGVKIDVKRAAERIFGEYDKNQDGSLSQEELANVPPVNANRRWYDADANGQISTQELQNGLRDIFNPNDGLLTVACEVTRNGKPLSGANVSFVPLPELDGAIPPASGITDKHGTAILNLANEDRPANTPSRVPFVRPGLYMVQVTHDQLKVPDEYNTKTKIGREVSGFTTAGGAMKIQLKF
jgi:EF hand